ncbi:MAG TPA: type IX secretion system membrane protein PorP/SprF [Flavobacteriales bacterium]|nr:type IX secretion system membrane protein PorP/SprF [Flavobacteriales bacterium]
MKRTLLYLLVFISVQAFGQNQINMGQYMVHQPFMNPASISSYSKVTFAGFYRSQWTQFDGAPVTQGFNAIVPLKRNKHTVSFTAFHDAIGINNNSEVSASYAYSMKTGLNAYLSFGISASLDLLQADYAKLHTIDPNDPLFQSASPLVPLPDFKFGMYFHKNRFYAGLALPNFMNNKIEFTSSGASKGTSGFDFDNLHFYLHTGYAFRLNDKWDLNTSTLIKEVSGAPVQFDLNAQLMFKLIIGFGTSYRSSREILGMITAQIIPTLKMSYGYEYNIGQIGKFSNGSHEILLIYQLNPPKEPVVSVPRF